MSDALEALKNEASYQRQVTGGTAANALEWAVDEIERLRERDTALCKEIAGLVSFKHECQAENAKLLAALEPYVADGWCPTCDGNCANDRFKEPPTDCVLDAASRALTQQDKP